LSRSARYDAVTSSEQSDLRPPGRLYSHEGFVAETVQAAWAWVDKYHPEDGGAFVQYVLSVQGPHIYAYRRDLAYVR
jgi:hypothetical protein